MSNKYKYKKTKKLIKQLKPFYKKFKEISDNYWTQICELETEIQKVTKIPGIELVFNGDFVGIGTLERTMELIQVEDLE